MTTGGGISLAVAIGARMRELRQVHGVTQQEVAEDMALLGFPWYRATVASLETGRRQSLSAEELVALPYALSLAIGAGPITLADLLDLPADVVVQLSDVWPVDGPNLAAVASGAAAVDVMAAMEADLFRDGVPFRPKLFDIDAEANAAQRLGLSLSELRDLATSVWRVSLSSRREWLLHESLAGVEDRPTAEQLRIRRRQITRQLIDELRPAVEQAKAQKSKGARRGTKRKGV